MSTTSSTPMPASGSLQLVEAVIERFDGAPVGERRRWSDEFKAQSVAAALERLLAGDPRTARPVPDLAKLKAAAPLRESPGFMGFG